MTEVSARLRAARERAGLTIQDVSASTRIRPASLDAIERGDFAALPGTFYTRAFLKTYASYLGLSPQEILNEYDADTPPPVSPQQRASSDAPWQSSARLVASQVLAAATSTGVVIALVVGLLAIVVARSRHDASPPPRPDVAGTTGAAASVPAAAATTGTAASPAAAPAPAQTLAIDIQAEAPLWVTGAADGKRVLYRLLAPGERVSIKASDTLAFRVGDASAFTFSINGHAGKPIGGPGEVRDIEITRDNFRSFLR